MLYRKNKGKFKHIHMQDGNSMYMYSTSIHGRVVVTKIKTSNDTVFGE